MPESIETNRENIVSDSLEFDTKPMDILLDAPKKDLSSNPPVLLPAARRRRSSSARSTVKTKEPEVVARRNARERRRVKLVNDGFLRLRKHVPTDPKNKKLSKVKTLRSAIEYIRHLQQLLNQASKNSSLQLSEFTKLDVLQGASVNGPNAWFPNLELVSIFEFFPIQISRIYYILKHCKMYYSYSESIRVSFHLQPFCDSRKHLPLNCDFFSRIFSFCNFMASGVRLLRIRTMKAFLSLTYINELKYRGYYNFYIV